MTKHLLEVDFDYDFDLIGISCHLRDYRMCWQINKLLDIALDRDPEGAETPAGSFVMFNYECPESFTVVHLLSNRGDAGWLVPEQRQADYLLLLRDNNRWEVDDLVAELREKPAILTAYTIDPEGLKSRENLLLQDL